MNDNDTGPVDPMRAVEIELLKVEIALKKLDTERIRQQIRWMPVRIGAWVLIALALVVGVCAGLIIR